MKKIGCGILYFYIHFVTEVACFFYLSTITNGLLIIWLIPFIYDGLAFVPQSLLGKLNDKYPKINLSLIGILLLISGFLIFSLFNISIFVSLILICLGNACIHVRGAEITLKNSNGMLSHSAIFVAGGSFGVVTGKLLANIALSNYLIILLILTTIPFILLAETYQYSKEKKSCDKFNYVNKNMNKYLIIFLAFLIVIIRGYMGYGIPTSWNKTMLETIIFFCTMGVGKALGGILSDIFGIKKIALISTLFSIPFLCCGDNYMIISLLGVALFSMTMSITLAIIVSVLKKSPGLAFGITTIGLFLGTAPIFFIKITNKFLNISLIIILSILCAIILSKMLNKGGDHNKIHL